MNIKVCGLKDPRNLKAVAGLAPNYVGFICYEKSPRYIGNLSAKELRFLPLSVIKTGVFVNEREDVINNFIDKYKFDAIQLHGDENPDFTNLFRNEVTVIKAFGIGAGFDFSLLRPYVGKVDFFLFDTKTDLYGGSGNTFDWAVLNNYQLDIPFFLSGGLSLDNLAAVKNISHPQFYGVDLNSRFETLPGVKDIDKLKKAFHMLKNNYHEVRS